MSKLINSNWRTVPIEGEYILNLIMEANNSTRGQTWLLHFYFSHQMIRAGEKYYLFIATLALKMSKI